MSNDTRFSRMSNEVVSGGTQRDPDAPPTLSTTLLGAFAWVALFAVLWLLSPWYVVTAAGLIVSIVLHEFGHLGQVVDVGFGGLALALGHFARATGKHHDVGPAVHQGAAVFTRAHHAADPFENFTPDRNLEMHAVGQPADVNAFALVDLNEVHTRGTHANEDLA